VSAITLIQGLGGGWDVTVPVQLDSSVHPASRADAARAPAGPASAPQGRGTP